MLHHWFQRKKRYWAWFVSEQLYTPGNECLEEWPRPVIWSWTWWYPVEVVVVDVV